MFSIVPELSEPWCSVLAHSVDCRNKPLPPYAGNLVFMLPVKHEMPSRYAVRIKLCKGVDPRDWQGTSQCDYSSTVFTRGRTWCHVRKRAFLIAEQLVRTFGPNH